MKTFGVYVGHENYWVHAEMLVSSIQRHFPEHKIKLLVNDTLDQAMIKANENDLRQQNQNVMIECIQIPEAYKRIPFADKLVAASIYESSCDEGYIWLDVDSYFFKSFDCNGGEGIQLNPVDQKNNGLFKKTLEAFDVLLKCPEIRTELLKASANEIFIHQAVFSAAVLKFYGAEKIMNLPRGVNYPMHFHHIHPHPIPINEIIHMRYDTFFEDQSIPDSWENLFSKEKSKLKMTWYY